jgi:hypothetical protein
MRAPDTLPPEIAADPRLVELAALLEEIRPVADAGRLERIDARAARALAAPAARRHPFRPLSGRMWAPALGVAACALLALAIALSTLGGPDTGTPAIEQVGGSSGAGGAVPSGDTASGAGSSASSAGSSGRSDAPPAFKAPAPAVADQGTASGLTPASRRAIERAVAMTLGTPPKEIDAVAAAVARVATTLGGYVASSSTATGSGGQLELRVPTARLDDAVARLSRLGHVRSLERSTLDITAEAVSARGRLADALAERRSLLRQLAQAATPGETERIRARLLTVWHQIQAARAGVRRVGARAALATVSVGISPERRAVVTGGGWTPRDALHDALRVLEVAFGIALIAFAVALPLVLFGAPAWLATRRLLRHRRERGLDAA